LTLPLLSSQAISFSLTNNNQIPDISILEIDPSSSSWIFDTSIELLLLLKNITFMKLKPEQKSLIKTILVHCYIIQSPFILPFLAEFAYFIQTRLIPSPFDSSNSFYHSLILLKNQLISRSDLVSSQFQIFLQIHEKLILDNKCKTIASVFPELFGLDDPPFNGTISIPEVLTEPGSITSNFTQHLMLIRTFDQHYSSLNEFPICDLFPYWFKLISGPNSLVNPKIERTDPTTFYLSNPSQIKVTIIFQSPTRFSADSILIMSSSPQFNESTFYSGNDINQPIITEQSNLYFSLVECPSGIVPNLQYNLVSQANSLRKGNASTFRDTFLCDLNQFALQWTTSDTEELLSIIPSPAFSQSTNTVIQSTVSESILASKFSKTVIILKALFLHQFNYLRIHHYNKVPKSIWDSMFHLFSNDAAVTLIRNQIKKTSKVPNITINRLSALRYVHDGYGSVECSILSQLTSIFKTMSISDIQNEDRP
jgi:hypothetical protein